MEGVLWGQLVRCPQAAVAVSALDAGDLSSCEGLGARPGAAGFFRSCPGCDHQPPSACLLRCRAGSSPKTGETSWGAGSREQIAEITTLPPRPARRAAELCFFFFFFLFLPRSPCSLPKVGKPSRSKHNTLPGGTLQIRSLGKDDHGEWECVATNVVASITASTHLTVVGTGRRGPRGLGDSWWQALCAPGLSHMG